MQRRLDALLLLDKPHGLSSNAALQQAKRLYRAQKAGHGGTLDPLASGLLPVLFGEATKFAGYALESDKEYVADVRMGITTATGDAEGEPLERRAVTVQPQQLAAALAAFRGEIEQVPPMHSALKHGGRPLYERARRGERVERRARRVRIRELELLAREGDVLRLRILCSKGTYVRSLAADLGERLGCGAHLCGLRRTAAGSFRVEGAATLEAIGALPEPERDRLLMPLEALLEGLPRIELAPGDTGRFVHGGAIHGAGGEPGRCRVYGADRGLLGLGERTAQGLRPLRLLAQPGESPLK